MKEQVLASDSLLVSQTIDDAFEVAVREYTRLVFRIAFSVLRNHHDAEDAAQETLLRVLRYRRRLERGIREPRTWIARIAWRVAVERRKRRPEISLSQAEVAHAVEELRSQLATVENSSSQNETALLVHSLIVALPDQLRSALTLFALHELTPREIARVLGTTEASIRSRIFRARQILKEKLTRLEGEHGTRR